MSKTNGKEDGTLNTPKGIGLGPVAREKYEAILQARLGACIAVQEAKIQARRADALKIFLEKNELVSKVATYRASLENLVAFFGEPDWRKRVQSALDDSREEIAVVLRDFGVPLVDEDGRPL